MSLNPFTWFRTTKLPVRGKSVLVVGADGKKHRTDPLTGEIIGKVARKRHLRALKKSAAASKDPIGSPSLGE